jgi:DNA-binding response OmpR family regulator
MKRSPPTFGVRFEAQDDFLVEYTDRLRHGLVLLPLPDPLPTGTKVRVKLELPDGAVLYLTGTAQAPPARAGASDPEGTTIRLTALADEHRTAMEKCVASLVGGSEVPRSAHALEDALEGDLAITVLLVDDSVSMRIELGDALRERGVRVRVAENGLVALSAALKRPPDVIVTDVEMPVMDGWTLLRSIRARSRLADVPIVFLTRLSDELSRLKGYRLGVDDYLSKTMPPEEIVARLQGVVARRAERAPVAEGGSLRGSLEHVKLGSVLAFLESERRSGALHVAQGADRSTLYLGEGNLDHVDNVGAYPHPHDRVFDLLSWGKGTFEFHADVPPPAGIAPSPTPLTYLLLEHARREDERKAAP